MDDLSLIQEDLHQWINNIDDQNLQQNEDAIIDFTPTLGMEFETEEIAYAFYNEYARRNGFGVRREYKNVSQKDGVLTSRLFTCHKEGKRGRDKRDHLTEESRAETRTQCEARMLISLNRKVGKYKVVNFVAKHNHPLQPLQYAHMISSHRRISESQGSQIDIAYESGLTLKASHEFMAKQGGGINSLGYTRQDQKNYLRTKRKQSFQFGDVGALLMYFKRKSNEEPGYFYEFQMDVDDEITNMFWADAQMINDYRYFGDVVTFDTTYRTNKEYRPLGVFVGLNNHRQTIVFGAALLYDETAPSFEWLFETFIRAMGGQKPKTILTDQDAAMAKAITSVLPETFHGLCTWHIRENALRHMNHLYQKDDGFAREFEACIDQYEEIEDFLHAWGALLLKNDVSSDSWLHSIFLVKEKWAWAYVRETFSAGMRSTQLSESLNADLKGHLKSDCNLAEFFMHFERVINGKRYNESLAEFDSIHKLPKLKINAPMLVQAGNVYTPALFQEFQHDYEEYEGAFIKEHEEGLPVHYYKVANVDGSKDREVVANCIEKTISCSCRKFETHGILCSHALKVLDAMNIKFLPEEYILERWTREARRRSNNEVRENNIHLDNKASFTKRYTELCHPMMKLVNRACESHETYVLMSKVREKFAGIVEQMLAKKSNQEGINECHVSSTMGFENAENFQSMNGAKGIKKRNNPYKGRGRPKTWLEKAKKRNRPSSTQDKATKKSTNKAKKTMEAQASQHKEPNEQNTFEATSSYTFTELLNVPLDDISLLSTLS